MPEIRPSKDLRTKYSEISDLCHTYDEPVYITKNGKGDLAVMSVEAYDKIAEKFNLNGLLHTALEDVRLNRLIPAEALYQEIEAALD